MLTLVGWGFWRRRSNASPQPNVFLLAGLYGGGAALAIPSVFQQLLTSPPAAEISPSFIYVFLRLPHHLNPYSWPGANWSRLTIFFLLFLLVVGLIRRYSAYLRPGQFEKCRDWAVLVLCSLVPYGLGLLLAPLDPEGKFLQYYPFRLGDVLLPLGLCFLLACLLEQGIRQWRPHVWAKLSVGLLLVFSIGQTLLFGWQLAAVVSFPGLAQGVNPAWAELCTWVRQNTAQEARFVLMPLDRDSFPWLAERSIVAAYKFLPQTPEEIVEWYRRMDDVTAGSLTQLTRDPNKLRSRPGVGKEIRQKMRQGFASLDTAGAIALMDKYDAPYFLTRSWHRLDLAIAHESFPYVLYQRR